MLQVRFHVDLFMLSGVRQHAKTKQLHKAASKHFASTSTESLDGGALSSSQNEGFLLAFVERYYLFFVPKSRSRFDLPKLLDLG